MALYLGEANGARVLSVGRGVISQVGDDYQVTLETWPMSPAGPTGDVAFRLMSVRFECVGDYSVGLVPIIDGVAQSEQTFSGSSTGSPIICQAHVAQRGTSGALRFRTITRTGALHVLDMNVSYVVLRESP